MKVGLIGTRGLVGSILLARMQEENDFSGIEPVFFSTSQQGKRVEHFPSLTYQNADDPVLLSGCDVIITCQGSDYTEKIYPLLRQSGWRGYFIDAASHLRLAPDSMICLDPVNRALLNTALEHGVKTFIGGNCTVSLLLMALGPLLASGEVESLTAMTYQAASGAGIRGITDCLTEMNELGALGAPPTSLCGMEKFKQDVHAFYQSYAPCDKVLGGVIAGNLLPWIDADLGQGLAREEAKMAPEAAKILGFTPPPMDCLCVRVGVLRCHSQAVTIRLKNDCSLEHLTTFIEGANAWVKVVPNNKEETLKHLTPAAISGSLTIAVGRIRKLDIPGNCWTLFTLGDQLLWGAAEPLRRMLKLIKEHEG